MQSQKSLKREFLTKWVTGLEKCSSLKDNMSLLERKKTIKLSADLAMASTRNATRSWSRALIARTSIDVETGHLAKRILGSDQMNSASATTFATKRTTTRRVVAIPSNKSIISRKVRNVKKYAPRKYGPVNSYKVRARCMAKRLVKKRTEILKGLVPGGKDMDEYSLIKEALDYIVSLRAQVDVMHHLANSSELLNQK